MKITSNNLNTIQDIATNSTPQFLELKTTKLYNVKCSNCGKDTKVIFEPVPGRPVYCKDCFAKQRESGDSKPFKKSEDSEEKY